MQNLLQNKVDDFFKSHPNDNIVYSALGNLFTEKERAEKYLGGVSGRTVVTHTREGVEHERPSDKMKYDIAHQENIVGEKEVAYGDARTVDKEATMGEWKAAQDKLKKMYAELEKQISREDKDDRISRSEKDMQVKTKPVTRETLVAKISAQEELIKGTQSVLDNKKVTGAKRKDVEKVLAGQEKELEALKEKLAALPAEEAAPVITEENSGGETTVTE